METNIVRKYILMILMKMTLRALRGGWYGHKGLEGTNACYDGRTWPAVLSPSWCQSIVFAINVFMLDTKILFMQMNPAVLIPVAKIIHSFVIASLSIPSYSNCRISIKTSQELRMLSRSLSDCKSLLLNLNLNLNRCLCLCLCSDCSDCSDCSVTAVSL